MLSSMEVMSPDRRGAPQHTGLAIAAIAAIPFVSVTAAAWLGDAASSTDPREAIAGGLALFGGLVMGLLVRRLVTTVDRHVRGAVRFMAASVRRVPGTVVETAPVLGRLQSDGLLRPALVFVPSEVGRRGPPIRLR